MRRSWPAKRNRLPLPCARPFLPTDRSVPALMFKRPLATVLPFTTVSALDDRRISCSPEIVPSAAACRRPGLAAGRWPALLAPSVSPGPPSTTARRHRPWRCRPRAGPCPRPASCRRWSRPGRPASASCRRPGAARPWPAASRPRRPRSCRSHRWTARQQLAVDSRARRADGQRLQRRHRAGGGDVALRAQADGAARLGRGVLADGQVAHRGQIQRALVALALPSSASLPPASAVRSPLLRRLP